MANPTKRLPSNIEGEFFVDSTCIDCDTCRQLAPAIFREVGGYSAVHHQPAGPDELQRAERALLCCPTGSIGALARHPLNAAIAGFPVPIEAPGISFGQPYPGPTGVHYCGFNSAKSFGGNAYFVVHPDGNWLVDAPRFLPRLVERIAEMGGLRWIFITHRDDVAEADRFAERFGAERIIHARDRSACPAAERVIAGEDPVAFGEDFLAIPTPGHTAGHMVLLYRDACLFTGDHLWWDRDLHRLDASRGACWDSWSEQVQSMARLQVYRFSWVLPGHGDRVHLAAERMAEHLAALISKMRR